MNTIFMNSENSKTFDTHRLLLNLTEKIDLRRKYRSIALSNLSIYYTWKNIKNSYQFELPDGSYSISDIQGYFEYILKTHGEKTVNPSIRIYINKIENRIKFKIKTRYFLELLAPKQLLGSTKSNITKDKNGENVPYLDLENLKYHNT